MAPFVLLLTGPPGSGKSETLTRVFDALTAAGIAGAAIDADELARAHPPIEQDRHLAHFTALCESFRQSGHSLLVAAVTAGDEAELHTWSEAAAAATGARLVVQLTAGPAALERRLRDREPAGWPGLPGIVETSMGLAGVRLDGADLIVDTELLGPDEVAALIERELRARIGT